MPRPHEATRRCPTPDLYLGLLLRVDEAGPVRWRERVLPSPVFLLVALGVAAALALVLVPLQGWEAVWGPVGLLAGVALLAGAASAEVYRVCERALVTGLSEKHSYVLPWASIDPGLVRLHTKANFLGRRIGTDVRRSVRAATWNGTVVSLVGLDPDYASAKRRAGRLEDVRQMLRHGQPVMPLPLTTWYFSPRDPEQMLRALEAALVAAGRPDAEGLAERCLAAPVRESYRTPLTDEQIYGGPPPRRL